MWLLLLCVCGGLVLHGLAQDCSKPPRGPNMTLRDQDIVLESFPDGSKAYFQCDDGYESESGSRSVTCTAGSWSAVTLKCERRHCGSAEHVSGGDIDYSGGTQFGDKAIVRCNEGFVMFGNKVLTCNALGSWTPHLPKCRAVVCDPPPPLKNGSFSPVKEVYKFREAIQYSCMKDHSLNGSATAVCSQDKTFKPAPPLCPKVKCSDLQVDHGDVGGSRPPHGHRASVTISCLQGYELVGSPNLICDINSQWLPRPPYCRLKSVVPPVVPTKDKTGGPTATPAGPMTPTDATPSNVPRAVGIAFAVLTVIGVVTVCGCYYGGIPAFIQRKRNAGSRNVSQCEGVKEAEWVGLSVKSPDDTELTCAAPSC